MNLHEGHRLFPAHRDRQVSLPGRGLHGIFDEVGKHGIAEQLFSKNGEMVGLFDGRVVELKDLNQLFVGYLAFDIGQNPVKERQ